MDHAMLTQRKESGWSKKKGEGLRNTGPDLLFTFSYFDQQKGMDLSGLCLVNSLGSKLQYNN